MLRTQVSITADHTPIGGTPQVLVHRDGFEMLGVHAQSHLTQVVDLHPLGYGGDVQLVRNTMSEHLLVLPGDLAIPIAHRSTSPHPALTLSGSRPNVSEKSFFKGSGPAFHE